VNSILIYGNTLSNVTGSNVTGNVANATVSLVVSQAAQPNITSVGLLTNLAVSNSLTTSNVFLSGALNVQGVSNLTNIYALRYFGDGGLLSNISSNAITQPFANLVVSNALVTTNIFATTANVGTLNVATLETTGNLSISGNVIPVTNGNTYVLGNLIVAGNVFSSLGTPLGEGGSLYYSLASNYTPPVYTGSLYGQALALNLGAFNEQGSSSLVSRSVNGNFRFSKPGVYNLRAIFLTNGNNIIGIGIGSNASDTTTRTDQTYVYRYTTFVSQNPTEVLDIEFYAGSPTDYYYVDLFAVDAPTLAPTSDPLGGTWLSMGPLQGSGGSGPPVTISTLGAVVTGRTTSYGAGVGDYYIGMSNGQTVNLPIGSSLAAGKQYIIKDESGLAGTFVGYRVTIAASAPDLIDGQTSVIIAINYGAINVIWTGSFWSIY
jgi:hypothetical protein